MEDKNKVSITTVIILMMITALVVYSIMMFRFNQFMNSEEMSLSFNIPVSNEDFSKLKRVMGIIENHYLKEYDVEKMQDGAIRGMLDALGDPYTSYFDKSETESFLAETEGNYDGVGMYVAFDKEYNTAIVLLPIENSPAERAGIIPGDYILDIDGNSVVGVSLEEVASRLKGTPGSSVQVKFLRKSKSGDEEEFEKVLVREKVQLSSFKYKLLEDDIGYITFSSFDENVTSKFNEAYKELIKKQKVKGLIIDLRDNPGGLLNVATDVADKLLPKGRIVYTIDKNGKEEVIESDSNCVSIPIVVVVNGNSASASEIMAAAIKDYGGKVVGKTTYGKGLVQEFKNLLDGTYVKVTISEYFSPKGNKIDKIGVIPDVEVEDDTETKEDEQLNAAIKEIKEMMK